MMDEGQFSILVCFCLLCLQFYLCFRCCYFIV